MRVPFQGGLLSSLSPLTLGIVAAEARESVGVSARRVGKTEALRDLIANPKVQTQVKSDGR